MNPLVCVLTTIGVLWGLGLLVIAVLSVACVIADRRFARNAAPAWQADFGDDNTGPVDAPTASTADVDAADAAWNDVLNILGPPPRTERIHLTDEEVDRRFAVFEQDAANEIQRRQRERQ